MANIELKRDLMGGAALAGDCGHIVGPRNADGTVNIVLTRRNCAPMLHLPVPSVAREDLFDCHCDNATYRVRSGDTLDRIAEFHRIDLDALLALNPQIDDVDRIVVGQLINVPLTPESGPSIHAALAEGDGPKWYQIACREMATGVDEIPGPSQHNPRIVEYHEATTLKATDDETPWCSSFVNWCMMKAGVPRTNSAAARSWLKWGQPLDQPRLGCVVVFERPPQPTSGHVAFFEALSGDRIRALGGNQGNQVNISAYRANQLLGYRWPTGA